MRTTYSRSTVFALTLLVSAFLFAPAALAGEQLRVVVPEPFELDGTLYEAGTITIREIGHLSPTATLNKICVDGASCLSFVLAETDDGATAQVNELIFNRSAGGHLVFDAVSWAGEPVRAMLEQRDPSPASGMLAANR